MITAIMILLHLYLVVRFHNLLILSIIFSYNLFILATALLFVFTLALVAKFHPYKYKRSNTVNIVILLAIISMSISSSMYFSGGVIFSKVAGRDHSNYSFILIILS